MFKSIAPLEDKHGGATVKEWGGNYKLGDFFMCNGKILCCSFLFECSTSESEWLTTAPSFAGLNFLINSSI